MTAGRFIPMASLPVLARGVVEHYHRARWFMEGGLKQSTEALNFRLLLAACYSARAVVEVMLEAAFDDQLSRLVGSTSAERRTEYEEHIAARLPRYFLIERTRIHDFHRKGLQWSELEEATIWLSGPVKFFSQNGEASLNFGERGAEPKTSGQAWIKLKRPLEVRKGLFNDSETGEWLSLRDALTQYFDAVPPLIDDFIARLSEREASRSVK